MKVSQNISQEGGRGGGGRGHFMTGGLTTGPTLTLSYTIFERNGTPFICKLYAFDGKWHPFHIPTEWLRHLFLPFTSITP